jgi:hypothetical protein
MKLSVLSSVLILFIFALLIPNSYGQTDEITMSVTTESPEYYLHQNILIEGKVSKYVPNTPISYFVYIEKEGLFGEEQTVYPLRYPSTNILPHSETGEFSFRLSFLQCDPNRHLDDPITLECRSNDKITVKTFYGYENNYFTTAKTTFVLNDEFDEIGNKMKGYLEFDPTQIGLSPNPEIRSIVYTDFLYSPWATYHMSTSTISMKYFENGLITLSNQLSKKIRDCSYFGGGYQCVGINPVSYAENDLEFLNSTNTSEIPEGFECVPEARLDYYSTPIEECWNGSLLIKVVHRGVSSDRTGGIGIAMKVILENYEINPISKKITSSIIESDATYNYNSTHIDNFPDSTKPPQHYLDRYNNEESYKEWFDTQFPNNTIHEILDVTEPEKPKIPAWVNNTMQWYLDGVISEDEMITAIQYLVKEGIIDIS